MKGTLLTLILLSALASHAITIDGMNITGDFANATWKVYQEIESDWGINNSIVAMYVETNDTHILVGIPGYVNDNAIAILFDANTELGTNAMVGGLTISDSVTPGMTGMRFDDEFAPEFAVVLRTPNGDDNVNAWPALENIVYDTRLWLGLLDDIRFTNSVVSEGGITLGAYMAFEPGLHETNTFAEGLEFQIAYTALQNDTTEVKIMVLLCGNDGTWASNQTLPPVPEFDHPHWRSSPSAEHDASQVPGEQFLRITIPSIDTNLFVSAGKSKALVFAESSPVRFSSVVTGGNPPYTYAWDLGNGEGTNVAEFTYAYPAAGQYTATLTVTDDDGVTAMATAGATDVYPPTIVDGTDIPAKYAAGVSALQDTQSELGPTTEPGAGAQLDGLYAFCDFDKLYIGVTGNITTGTPERALAVFIDSDYSAGTNVLPEITTGFPPKLEGLAGMTFDTDFTPDKAVIISVGSPGDFWVNIYHINSNEDWYWDRKTEYQSIFDPFQRVVNDRDGNAGDIIALNNNNTALSPGDATTGFEMMLDIDTLYDGLNWNPAQETVRIQAILYESNTNIVRNQSLPGIGSDPNGYGAAPEVDYSQVSGLQYIEVCAPIPEPSIMVVGILALVYGIRRFYA